jgi:hypothetical protein
MGKYQLIHPAARNGIAAAPRRRRRIEDRMDPNGCAMRSKKTQTAPLNAHLNWLPRAENGS